MKSDRQPFNSQYVIATFRAPTMWHRTDDECWLLNPLRRHIMHSDHLGRLSDQIEAISDLKGTQYYTPLIAGKSLAASRVLIERNRDRGIGDLLFLTGPLNFMQNASGNNVKIDVYALAERGAVLTHHPALHLGTTLHGPLFYDDLGLYNYQWLIETVTECNEEPDQLNVYDALYKQLGFDPGEIDPKYKRPTVRLVDDDFRSLDQVFYHIWTHKKADFRRLGYYVVAPFAAATLRSMNYSTWIGIIKELAAKRPVIVTGAASNRHPDMDISAGEFQAQVSNLPNVVNAIGATPIRTAMALISKAVAVVTLDSGSLYIAQATGTPAISMWGSHDPGVRIGYDKNYMDLAIWNQPSCRMSPCFAYASFPAHKCSLGAHQQSCDVLASVTPDQVLEKLEMIESLNVSLGKFQPGK
jgi:ADP-heptose:LPS heptosyltransferase